MGTPSDSWTVAPPNVFPLTTKRLPRSPNRNPTRTRGVVRSTRLPVILPSFAADRTSMATASPETPVIRFPRTVRAAFECSTAIASSTLDTMVLSATVSPRVSFTRIPPASVPPAPVTVLPVTDPVARGAVDPTVVPAPLTTIPDPAARAPVRVTRLPAITRPVGATSVVPRSVADLLGTAAIPTRHPLTTLSRISIRSPAWVSMPSHAGTPLTRLRRTRTPDDRRVTAVPAVASLVTVMP